MDEETITCRHCGEILYPGETYYFWDGNDYCPDCFLGIIADHKRTVSETVERI